MIAKGFKRNFRPIKMLTDEQIDKIHLGTLRILEETGLRIEHERALNLLRDNGCNVDFDKMQCRFPSWLVEECLRKCPRSFRIKARRSANDITLGENTLYFSTTPGMQTVDLDTWEPRPPTREEFYQALTVIDGLDNPQMTSNYYPWFGWEGLSSVMCIPEGFAARVRNTSKVLSTAYSNNCEIFTIAMAKAVDAEAFIAPLPSQPLTYSVEAIEALYRGLNADFPFRFISGLVMGATSPATIAGSVVMANATAIAGIVLTQLIRPGARVAASPQSYPQNMRTGLCDFGNIGESLHRAASNQYWQRVGIPTLNICGYSNSKLIDFQCGYERTIQAVIAALSGTDVIAQGGAMHAELTLHPILMVLDNDTANMIGRFMEGVEVTDETLALDLINEVGPIPGMYLDKEHTRRWWKKEQFMPKAADRLGIPEWIAKGKKSAIDYAQERMEEILATHTPAPLTPSQEEDIDRILGEAREYYRKKGMLRSRKT